MLPWALYPHILQGVSELDWRGGGGAPILLIFYLFEPSLCLFKSDSTVIDLEALNKWL